MSKLFELFGVELAKGEYLFKEGDSAKYMYMIHEGSVEINIKSGDSVKKVKTITSGEFVGEMAIIDAGTRSANAIALEDCKLIKMDKVSFDETIKTNHMLALGFIQVLSQRLRDTNNELAACQAKLQGQ